MNRSQRCGQCRGCTAKPCGRCIYCQDSPQFGGPGVKKQSCIERRCLKVLENRLQRDGPSLKAKVGCGACDECLTPDCHSCLICLDKKFFENRYLPGAMCAKKRCNQARSLELTFAPPHPGHLPPPHHLQPPPGHLFDPYGQGGGGLPPRHVLQGLYAPVFHHHPHHHHPPHPHQPQPHPSHLHQHHGLAGPGSLMSGQKRSSPGADEEDAPCRKKLPMDGLLVPGAPFPSVQQVPHPYPLTVGEFPAYPLASTNPAFAAYAELYPHSAAAAAADAAVSAAATVLTHSVYSQPQPSATTTESSFGAAQGVGPTASEASALSDSGVGLKSDSSLDSSTAALAAEEEGSSSTPFQPSPLSASAAKEPSLGPPASMALGGGLLPAAAHLSPSYWQPYGLPPSAELDQSYGLQPQAGAFGLDPAASALIPPSLSGSPQVVLQPL